MTQTASGSASMLRRVDHVGIAVRDLRPAVDYFTRDLGLRVAHTEEVDLPPVTLIYLDAGNLYIQLVSPRAECEISRWLSERGDGVHHVCFAVDDVPAALRALSTPGAESVLGSGRGRVSGFVRNGAPFGVLIECTEFRPEDVSDGRALHQEKLT